MPVVPPLEPSTAAADDLLCATLRGERVQPSLLAEAAPLLLKRARFHGVEALLLRHAPRESWPPELFAELRARSIQLAMWELAHQQLLKETLAGLREIDVAPVLIKGTALAYSLYPDPALRARGDTDLIIPLDARQRVQDRLSCLGFERHMAVSGEFVSYQASYTRKDPVTGWHTLDLHWKVNNSELLSKLFTYEELRAEAQALPQLCAGALGTSRVHALLLACMHRATHKQNPYHVDGESHHDADRLIWLYDIHLLANELNPAEWDRFTMLATRKGLRGVCLEGLQHAAARFPTPVPPAVLARAAKPAVDEAAARYLESGKLRQQWLDFVALGGLAHRLSFLHELLFPGRPYLRTKFPDASESTPVAWLYLKRAWSGTARRLFRSPPGG